MSREPIIIDGVDISKCECCSQIDLDSNIICISNFPSKKSGYCKDNTNCLFKQLACKTQECEELREYHNKCCEEFENEKKELLEKYNQLSIDFYSGKYCNVEKCKQLDQLKAEKAKLEAQIEADTQYHVKEECNLRSIIRNKRKRNAELYKENNQLKAENRRAEQKLERIRQMLKNGVKIHDDIIVNKSILQIIDEVE